MTTDANLTDPADIGAYYNRIYQEIGLDGLRRDPGDPYVRYLCTFLDEPGHILDLAAGFGRNALHLMDDGHRITAIDISDDGFKIFLEEALTRYQNATVRLKLRTGDVMALDWGAGYDAVMALFLLHHLTPDQFDGLFDKIERALKPEGYLIFTAYLDPISLERDPYLSYFGSHEDVLGLLAGRTWEVQAAEVHGAAYGIDPPIVHCLAQYSPPA